MKRQETALCLIEAGTFITGLADLPEAERQPKFWEYMESLPAEKQNLVAVVLGEALAKAVLAGKVRC